MSLDQAHEQSDQGPIVGVRGAVQQKWHHLTVEMWDVLGALIRRLDFGRATLLFDTQPVTCAGARAHPPGALATPIGSSGTAAEFCASTDGAQPARLASTTGSCRLEVSHAVAWSSVAGGRSQPPPAAGYSGGYLWRRLAVDYNNSPSVPGRHCSVTPLVSSAAVISIAPPSRPPPPPPPAAWSTSSASWLPAMGLLGAVAVPGDACGALPPPTGLPACRPPRAASVASAAAAMAAAAASADCRHSSGRRSPEPEFEAVSEPGAAGDRSSSPPPLPSPPVAKAAAPVAAAVVARFRVALDALPVAVCRPAAALTETPAHFLRSRLLPRVDPIGDEDEEEDGVAAAAEATTSASPVTAAADDIDSEEEGAFYGVDLGAVASRLWEFHAALPRVRPHFAVKCNPDPVVVSLLAALGASFDCASEPEIDMVAAALGGDSAAVRDRVVYANPCKAASHVAFARSAGVSLTTFDNADELVKMAAVAPDARLLLRIATEDAAALCPLSSKFGAALADVPELLRFGARLGLSIVGVAFHVGSGCTSLASYATALNASRAVFDTAAALGLPPMTVLDIGGGFPGFDGDSSITFDEIVAVVRPLIDELFAPEVDVIAEPGRYLVTSAYSLATQVLSRRFGWPADGGDGRGAGEVATPHAATTVQYHLGDGVYGSFKDAVILGVHFPPRVLAAGTAFAGAGLVRQPIHQGGDGAAHGGDGGLLVLASTLCGPTNDPLDVVARGVPLPLLSVGDWLYFDNMGAYTTSLCTGTDDTTRPPLYYYSSV